MGGILQCEFIFGKGYCIKLGGCVNVSLCDLCG